MAADSAGVVGTSGSRFLLMGNRNNTGQASVRWHGSNFDGPDGAFPVGQWTHFAVSKTPGSSALELYINGALYGSTGSAGNIPELVRNFGDRRLDALIAGDVAFEADAAEFGRDLLGALFGDVENGNFCALLRQRARSRLAEAGTAAGDQRDLTGWVHVGFLQNVMNENNVASS
jgi:hypothetical protein